MQDCGPAHMLTTTASDASLCTHRGVCKIVAPDGWAPCSSGKYSHLNFEITKPIRQNAIGNRGVFRMVYTEEKSLSNRELQASEAAKAAEQQRCSAEHAQRSGTNDVERKCVSLRPRA
eukprot:scaffold318793_cov22-Tisochrysis_lutea.AAC.1